jgi:hypothetical protein
LIFKKIDSNDPVTQLKLETQTDHQIWFKNYAAEAKRSGEEKRYLKNDTKYIFMLCDKFQILLYRR